ncbi:TIR domain-containing protein [candidate division KSB1 bacterium]|nr:TIR domain-containing protein [candidate division KSB1 bacterium]
MSRKPPAENKPNADAFSEALTRIEQARETDATELDLSGLGLTELPEALGQLMQLQALNLYNTQLTVLPEWLGQLTQLGWLDLSDNKLTALPEWLGKLTQLQRLYLSANQFTVLPKSLGQLTQLVELRLSNNQLTTLPKSLGQLTQLLILDLHNNQLMALPESLGQLMQLQQLDLSYNHLTVLPESLRQLKSLGLLFLHGNSALAIPVEVLGPTRENVFRKDAQLSDPSKILEYYFRMLGGRRPLNEAKLILVGRGSVGKTSLVNRLLHNRFNKNEKKTEGIRITEWPLRLNHSEEVRLNIWDFGGQEIMHSTHQFFLTERSLYLLVLNGREGGEDADAEYWLKLIESFGSDSPVIVVLNKIKEHPFDLNRRALQQKYPAIRAFIATDCKDHIGIKELHKIIKKETDRLEHLRDAFPASWFNIKDQLAGMKKNYLSFEEYCKVCAKNGEKDAAAQEKLAFYLHSLGIALNYKDDPRLQDTHVLNPHWVTNGIYKILNAERLAKQKGVIHLKNIPSILDSKKYPSRMHCFLFDLMKKFELCFSFPDDDTRYLIPELLDKQEPVDTKEFPPQSCLNFEYHYPILPEGLLPRFIVRTHMLSEGLSRWRTGVILKFEANRALVKADVHEKKVFISVLGPAASRGRLLAIIRSDFERIHRDIFKSPPVEMVPLPEYPHVVVPYRELQIMEEQGEKELKKVVGEQVLNLDVQMLLNGVDLQGTVMVRRERTGRRPQFNYVTIMVPVPVRLFISYTHKDERQRNELEIHLKLLQRQGLIETWHDRKIEAGEEWKRKIDNNLERADIILLLVSADFIASDYCYEIEMKRALERHEKDEARVIPVIVRDCNWHKAPFAKLQALPKAGKAVKKWADKDSAWRNVAEGIERVVEEIRKKKE